MTGTLGLFSLLDLFQLLASSSRTGRLAVEHPKGGARIYFDKGRVVHADFAGAQGEAAVFALFADERGSFEFSLGLPAPERSITLSTENLLLEAIRRIDEARRSGSDERNTLSDDSVPYSSDDTKAGRLTLFETELLVLRRIDGQRSLAQIAHEAGLTMAEVKRIVTRLVSIGVLAVHGKKPRVARLLTQLGKNLPPRTVALSSSILTHWEHALGAVPTRVACKRPEGQIDVFAVQAVPEAGPYLLLSRDTLVACNLAVNTTVLVKPVAEEGARV